MFRNFIVVSCTVATLAYGAYTLRPAVTGRKPITPPQQVKGVALQQQIQASLAKNDFGSAEKAAKQFQQIDSGADGHRILADVYFAEGNNAMARQEYGKYFSDPGLIHFDEQIAVRYGDLAAEAGDAVSARKVFSRVVDQYENQPLFKIPVSDPVELSLTNLKGIATAIGAIPEMGPRKIYLDESAKAVSFAPNSALVAYVRADAQYRCGLWADSRKEFDRAIELAPSSERNRIRSEIDRFYEFHSWDSVSKAVIGKGGKMTITTQAVPLPNEVHFIPDRPMASSPAQP